jgi:hypothetical protein
MKLICLLLTALSLLLIAGCPRGTDDTASTSADGTAADSSAAGEAGSEAMPEGGIDHSQLEVPEETVAADEEIEQVLPADPELLLVHEMVHALNQYYGEGYRGAFHPDTPERSQHDAFFEDFKTKNQKVTIERLMLSSADESNRYIDYEFAFLQNPGGSEVHRMSGCISVALDDNGDWKIVSWDQSGAPCPPPAASEEPPMEGQTTPGDPGNPPADGIGGGEGGSPGSGA